MAVPLPYRHSAEPFLFIGLRSREAGPALSLYLLYGAVLLVGCVRELSKGERECRPFGLAIVIIIRSL